MARIAMIEDDDDLRISIQELCELLGHEFSAYSSAKQFFDDAAKIRDHEIIITDYYLEDQNGVAIAQELRSRNVTTPIILLTGSRETFIGNSIAQVPNCVMLIKPCKVEDLEALFDKFSKER